MLLDCRTDNEAPMTLTVTALKRDLFCFTLAQSHMHNIGNIYKEMAWKWSEGGTEHVASRELQTLVHPSRGKGTHVYTVNERSKVKS